MANIKNSNTTMEELLASLSTNLKLSRGQEIKGEVVSKDDKELILDLGTKSEGVIFIRDVPPAQRDEIKVGSQLDTFVIEPENESGQVVLSLQRAQKVVRSGDRRRDENTQDWSKVAEKYTKDEIVKGTVAKITQIGVFITLEEGIEGLMHISKLGPDDNFETGQPISVMIDSVDIERKRISLAPVITSTKDLIYK